VAIFLKQRRISYVQAEDYCLIAILAKEDIDSIILSFPQVKIEFEKIALERATKT